VPDFARFSPSAHPDRSARTTRAGSWPGSTNAANPTNGTGSIRNGRLN
jgi:hypothetical protein